MGNHTPQTQRFNYNNWKQISPSRSEIVTYQNNQDHNIHIEKHRVQFPHQEDYQKFREYSFFRKHNPRWVSALYFQEDEANSQFCNSKFEASLYLQKIPVRLCDIRNIPFPDALHLYDQCLNGYSQLARHIGCFLVESDFIGINELGIVKVWAGAKWAQISIRGGSVSQQDMVRSIIQILEECIDITSMPVQNPSIRNFIYRMSDQVNFEQAILQFQNYARSTCMGGIPSRLICIDAVSQLQSERNVYERVSYIPQEIHVPSIQHYTSPYSSNPQTIQHISPRFSQRKQPFQENITTFRRVDSIGNESVSRMPAQLYNREQKAKSQMYSQPKQFNNASPLVRVLQNNKLILPQNTFNRNSSMRHISLANQFHQPNIQLNNHQISYNYPSAQKFNHNPIIDHLYQPIRYNENSVFQPQQQIIPIVRQSNERTVIYSNSTRQSQLFQPNEMRPTFSKDIPHVPFVQSNIYRNDANQSNKALIEKNGGDSIIMQLNGSNSHQNFNRNTPINPPKKLNGLKHSQSMNQFPNKYESAPIQINSYSIKRQSKYVTPINEEKNKWGLKSIEQLQTQNYWKSDFDSRYKSELQGKPIKMINEEFQQASYENIGYESYNSGSRPIKYESISEDDGKSSDQFFKKLLEMGISMGSNQESKVQYSQLNNHKKQEEKYDFPDNSRGYLGNVMSFGRSAESKLSNAENVSQNTYYENPKQFKSRYNPAYDADLMADLQKYKQ